MRVSLLVLLVSALAGCPSPTQKSLRRAQKALEDCDIREANTHFEEAYGLSGDDLDAALGFALTDLILLPEDPNVTRVLKGLGAERAIDMESFFYGEGAVLSRLAANESCDALDAFVQREIPYEPLRDDADVEPLDLIDPNLTIEQLLRDLAPLDKRLERLAGAFEVAATELEEPYVIELEGSCGAGLGAIAVQRAELYGAAAVIQALRAGIRAGEGYDWDLAIADLASEDPWLVTDVCNEHLLHVDDPASFGEAADTLLAALELADLALVAARDAAPVPDAAFDWSKLDDGFVEDLRVIGGTARTSLREGIEQPIPFWTPALGANVGLLFAEPPDAGALDGPLFYVASGYYGGEWMEGDVEQLEALFRPYFDREVFDSGEDEYWDVEHWDGVDLESVFNPGGRYDDLSCN